MTDPGLRATAEALSADLRGRRPQARLFEVEGASSRVIGCVGDGHCEVYYIGECTPAEKIKLFSAIKAAGAAVNTLMIDFSLFTGVIDWEYSKQQKNVSPGIEPPPARVAYVASHPIAQHFATAILLHSQQTWQVFTDVDEARAWLGRT